MHIECASDIARALQSLNDTARASKKAEVQTRIGDRGMGNHLAFSYDDKLELEAAMAEFVRNGIDRDKVVMLVAPKGRVGSSTAYLRESGIELNALIASGEVAVVSIDTSPGNAPGSIVRALSLMTQSLRDVAREKEREGVDVHWGWSPGTCSDRAD